MYEAGIICTDRFYYKPNQSYNGRVYWNGKIYAGHMIYLIVKPAHGRFDVKIGLSQTGITQNTSSSAKNTYHLNTHIFHRIYSQITQIRLDNYPMV